MNAEQLAARAAAYSPLRHFLPYQRKWLDDDSRFKIGLWSRQSGKDFTCAAEAVFDCMQRPKTTWLILAAGERQALESFEKAKVWAEIAHAAVVNCSQNRAHPGALLHSSEILFQNGSRLLALPAKPETVRGYSANLVLTEFAFHERPAEIWRAIYPSISNPLRGGEKKLRIISTPNGFNNKFHQLWHNTAYSRHRITIHDAVAAGLPVNIDELRNGLGDPDAWMQEYECNFMDSASVLLPYELIQSCEHKHASATAGFELAANPVYLGIDFGRKHDLTVCWALECKGDELWTREVLVLPNMSTPDQIEILRPRIKKAALTCLDYTGPGIGLGDFLAKEFAEFNFEAQSGGKVELCTFTPQFKAQLFSKLRMSFEGGKLRIPIDVSIREDLHALQRVVGNTGAVSYRSTVGPDGHSDRATALALALRAASTHRPRRAYQVVRPWYGPRPQLCPPVFPL